MEHSDKSWQGRKLAKGGPDLAAHSHRLGYLDLIIDDSIGLLIHRSKDMRHWYLLAFNFDFDRGAHVYLVKDDKLPAPVPHGM